MVESEGYTIGGKLESRCSHKLRETGGGQGVGLLAHG